MDFDCGTRKLESLLSVLFLSVCSVFNTQKHTDNVLRKPIKQLMKWLHVGVIVDSNRKDLS